ncbi:serine/threonine-protein kinase 11-interacting protein-like [Leptodactylus fuscus]|uniref:serine/threonine-protein kinase 11-interacting protein-like n=1 Tax=Leptodactylus fuscus TaxID=238119 RepID=UPI003F4EEA0B
MRLPFLLELSNNLHTQELSHNLLNDCGSYLELRYLNLGYNLLVSIPELNVLSTTHLQTLILRYHQLSSIRGQEHLRSLQNLDLSYNLMVEPIQPLGLAKLQKLREGSNLSKNSIDPLLPIYSEPVKAASKKRKKSKVKVNIPHIAEQDYSECEQRRQPKPPELKYQKEMDSIVNFRNLYGTDWLLYRPHLERELAESHRENSPDPTESSSLDTTDLHLLPIADNQSHVPEISDPDTDKTPSTDEDELKDSDVLIEKNKDSLEDEIFQWADRSKETEEDITDNPVSSLVAACPVVDGKPRDPNWSWVLLQVTERHLLEIELRRGQVLFRRDLRKLLDIKTKIIQWTMDGVEEELPLLTLSFYSSCKDEQSVSYVVLDNTKKICVENLLKELYPVLERNLKVKETDDPHKFNCLKCTTKFIWQLNSGQDSRKRIREELPDDLDVPDCPYCGSSYVVTLPMDYIVQSSGKSPDDNDSWWSIFKKGSGSSSTCTGAKDELDSITTRGKVTPEVSLWDRITNYFFGSKTPVEDEFRWPISPSSLGPHQFLDFRRMNQHLKLYLSMEILNEEKEEFKCAMKVPVIRFGNPEEVWNLVVLSSQKIYFLEITGDIGGSPDEWLQLRDSYALTSLTHLHLGLQEQCLYLGFDSSNATYTLLTRNHKSTTTFSRYILDTISVLPAHIRANLHYSPKEEVTPGHRLWHLLHDSLGVDQAPGFLYVLAHYKPEGSIPGAVAVPCANANQPLYGKPSNAALAQGATKATAVSLLLTKTHMYLLEEDHQWLPVAPSAGEGDAQELPKKVTIKEEWEIFVMMSLHLFKCAPLHLRIRLYHEVRAIETAWLLWTEDPSLPEEIVEWFRDPWEAIFQIGLQLTTHETMESYEPIDG